MANAQITIPKEWKGPHAMRRIPPSEQVRKQPDGLLDNGLGGQEMEQKALCALYDPDA